MQFCLCFKLLIIFSLEFCANAREKINEKERHSDDEVPKGENFTELTENELEMLEEAVATNDFSKVIALGTIDEITLHMVMVNQAAAMLSEDKAEKFKHKRKFGKFKGKKHGRKKIHKKRDAVVSIASENRANGNKIVNVENAFGELMIDAGELEELHFDKRNSEFDDIGVEKDVMRSMRRGGQSFKGSSIESILKCDSGNHDLEKDFDGSRSRYICEAERRELPVIVNLEHVEECLKAPRRYVPQHICMRKTIEYDYSTIPLIGPHRPIWPVYGEYTYLPVQRWLHNIEHGAIVMLYHPCANLEKVEEMKSLVRNCIRRHIITPYERLTKERPFALLGWLCRLEMAYIDPEQVIRFIRERSRNGPEANLWWDGNFRKNLLHQAKTVEGSNKRDKVVCPNSP